MPQKEQSRMTNGSADRLRAYLCCGVTWSRTIALFLLPFFCHAALGQDCSSLSQARAPEQWAAAECFAGAHQWEAANRAIQKYRKSSPTLIGPAILQAQILIELQLLPDARDVVQHLAAVHPHSIEVLSFYADLCGKLGEFAEAEQLLREATKYAPGDFRTWRLLGDFYLERGNGKAVEAYRKAAELHPQDAGILSGYALSLGRHGYRTEATVEFERALKIDRAVHLPSVEVELRYATFLRESEKYRESIQYYSAALEKEPKIAGARLERAQSLMAMKEWTVAEDDLKICSRDEKIKAQALPLLLRTLQEERKTGEAEEVAKQVEKESDADISTKAMNNEIAAGLRNANALRLEKKDEEAIALYQQLLTNHPEVVSAWSGLGLCHAEMGNFAEAEADFWKFLNTSPDSASVHYFLGRLLLRENKPLAARQEFEQTKALDPLFSQAELGIAATHMSESNYRAAIAELRSSRGLPLNDPAARLMLAEALYKDSRPDEALDQLEQVLKIDPENERARRMRKAILTKQEK